MGTDFAYCCCRYMNDGRQCNECKLLAEHGKCSEPRRPVMASQHAVLRQAMSNGTSVVRALLGKQP